MANSYATIPETFADMSEGNYTSVDSPEVERFIIAASRLIDAEFGRWAGFFYPTTDDVTRYYDGSGGDEQEIDEFVSITSVSVAESGGTASTDYTLWGSTDYQVEPYNYVADGKPIKKLVIDINGSKPGWYGYRKSIKVVGIAGYSTTTAPLVAAACRLQAVRWFQRAKGGW